MDINAESLKLHEQLHGKIEVISRRHVETAEDLSLVYTPGVAEPCRRIQKDPDLSFQLTRRSNLVAVITDGSAVLGLGNIGGVAGMPVMEGKCALFKEFAGVDAFPLCVATQDVDELVDTIARIADSFGGINLEDISAPRCFEVERKLKERCSIPVFHDDQHGTAIVVSAAMLNAVKLTGKTMGKLKIVINGAGAAGCAIARLLLKIGFGEVLLCDSRGIVCEGDPKLTAEKEKLSHITNLSHVKGTLADAMRGADVVIGVSKPGVITQDMVRSMHEGMVFALANPVPEIMPQEALEAGAVVVGTGRSDFPNQINNVLIFPGIFKGALSVRAKQITENMKEAAAYAIASIIPEKDLRADYILPSALDKRVAEVVAKAAAEAAIKDGVARIGHC